MRPSSPPLNTQASEVSHDQQQNSRLARSWPWLLLLVLGVAWGGSFSLAKIAVDEGAHPLGVNYWQSLIGAAILISYLVLTKQSLPIGRNYLSFYLICGFLGSVVPGLLYFYAVIHVSPGVLAITIATVPIMTYIAAALIKIERRSTFRILGVCFGALSIILLIVPTESLPDRSAVPWVFAAIAAAACYTGENLVIAIRLPPGANAFVVLGGMLITATLIMTPFVLATDTFVPLSWPWGASDWAIIGLAILSVVCYGLFIGLVVRAGPVFASQTAYIVTLSGVFWGILIFGEKHSLWIWASLASMLIALALVTPRKEVRP
ncbi:MAG TPA: DMT family transporter [Alphaproteobacteria bacterium]|nr:DMT family transporter [Alphaproteobacteria bacterium]